MLRQLIINADGFGFTQGINKGIIESIKKGVVSSISCNVNFPYINDIKHIVKHYPQVSIGLHLNINEGKPISSIEQIPSLVNGSGEFWSNDLVKKFILRRIDLCEVQKECEAQIIKLQSFGIQIAHLDSHQHMHLLPGYFGVVLKLGQKYGLKRIRCHNRYLVMEVKNNRRSNIFRYYITHPKQIMTHLYARILMKEAKRNGFIMADRLITPAYTGGSFKYLLNTWVDIIRTLPPGINEIFCHPGYPDDDLKRYSKYIDERLLELTVLTSPELIKCIQEENVQIVSFNQL